MQIMGTAIRLVLVLATVGGGFAGFLLLVGLLFDGSSSKLAIWLMWGGLLVFSGITIVGLTFVITARVGRPMILALGSMVPWLDMPGFKYQLTSVMYMVITFGAPGQLFGWGASLGSSFSIRIGGSPDSAPSFGINLFAVLLLLLATAYKCLPSESPSGKTAH